MWNQTVQMKLVSLVVKMVREVLVLKVRTKSSSGMFQKVHFLKNKNITFLEGMLSIHVVTVLFSP